MSTPENLTHTFEVRLEGGAIKKCTAFRRKPGGSFYIRVSRDGRDVWKSLKVKGESRNDLAVLKSRAKNLLEEAAKEQFGEAQPRSAVKGRKKIAVLGEVIARYRAGASELGFRHRVDVETANGVVSHLRRVMRIALDVPEGKKVKWERKPRGERRKSRPPREVFVDPTDAISMGALNADLVTKFLTNYMRSVDTPDRKARDQIAVDKRLNGAAHALRKAKSIFAKNKMALYAGLALPDLTGFLQAAKMPVKHTGQMAIGSETVASMNEEARKLKEGDLRQWLIHILLKHLSLRPSEVMEAQMSWLIRADWGQWFFAVVVSKNHRPKASLGYTPIAKEVAAEIVSVREKLAERSAELLTDESPLVPGNREERRKAVYREHSKWMRRFVPAESHRASNYELRRWGIQVIRRKYGKEAASDFARHAAQDVTQAHYLERINVWRDRDPSGDAGITWDDAVGVKPENPEQPRQPVAADWRALSGTARS